jgi:hypothetical protein
VNIVEGGWGVDNGSVRFSQQAGFATVTPYTQLQLYNPTQAKWVLQQYCQLQLYNQPNPSGFGNYVIDTITIMQPNLAKPKSVLLQ